MNTILQRPAAAIPRSLRYSEGFLSFVVHKAILIYNPASGQNRERRSEQVLRAAEVLRAAGVEAQTCATTGAGSAIRQAQQAAAVGFDTIIACGGDGTVNEVGVWGLVSF